MVNIEHISKLIQTHIHVSSSYGWRLGGEYIQLITIIISHLEMAHKQMGFYSLNEMEYIYVIQCVYIGYTLHIYTTCMKYMDFCVNVSVCMRA